MRWIQAAAYVAILCLVGCQRTDVDHSQRPAATGPAGTEKKAEALEQDAAAAGNKAPPSPSGMIARKALNLQLTDRTGGALNFHQRNATPGGAAQYSKTVQIGEFIFYKPRGGEAR